MAISDSFYEKQNTEKRNKRKLICAEICMDTVKA